MTNLHTVFRTDRGPVIGVDDVSLTVQQGETLGIVGESGSGKSVLLRSLTNLLPANAVSRGSVRLAGRELRGLAPKATHRIWGNEIALILQDPMTSLNPVLTTGRHLIDPLRYHLRLSRRQARRRAAELLREVGIPDPQRRIDQYPHELSGGMRQRVMVAVALSCEPQLLLADEPTTALDVTVQKQILDLLSDVQDQRQMAMILVTHDLGVVAGRTDRTVVMYGGRIVEHAATASLLTQPRHPYTYSLLRCTPRVSHPRGTRLASITGQPPILLHSPTSCTFAARCPFARSRCVEDVPVLQPASADRHAWACWYPVDTNSSVAWSQTT